MQQFKWISTILNQHQQGTLSRNPIQNGKNDINCLDITLWSGKTTIDLPMLVFDENRNDPMNNDDVDTNETNKISDEC